MKSNLRILIVVLPLFFLNCSEDPTTPTGDFDVSGRVLQKGVAVENALVKLDDPDGIKTATDRDGYFKLLNVSKGNYELTVSKNSVDGSFSERTNSIAVDSDISLDNLILPKGIKVYEPENITDKTLELIWSATDASDFREYKVYQHNTSGLDETTGILIHVSTSINDTLFQVPDLNPLEEYFFRVYLMNDFGRLGGSNIVNAKTGVSEIIKNGSFEVLNPNTGDPVYWNVWNNHTSFNVDSTLAHSGKNSMRLDVTEQTPVASPLYQLIDPVLFVGGERYRITYWIKTLNMSLNSYWFESLIHSEPGDWYLNIASLRGPIQDSDWSLVEYDFTYPLNNSTSNIRLDFYPEIPAEFQLWIDSISLTKVE